MSDVEIPEADIEALREFIGQVADLAHEWWRDEMPESPEAILAVRSLTSEVLRMLTHVATAHGTVNGCNFVVGFLGTVHSEASHMLGDDGNGVFFPSLVVERDD